MKHMDWDDSTSVSLQLWDIAGMAFFNHDDFFGEIHVLLANSTFFGGSCDVVVDD
ncbi:hypothetical protein D3C80_2032910 [compost metagenome]